MISVLWHDRGGDILVDAGKYGYQSDEFRAYCISTRAHNTVEVDGVSYSRAAADAHGGALAGIESHDWGFELCGIRDHRMLGVTHRRVLLLRPGSWLIVLDELLSEQPHAYTQWLHLAPRFRMTPRGSGFVGDAGSLRLGVTTFSTRAIAFTRVRGQTSPAPQGWISQGYGQVQENDALAAAVDGDHAVIATVLALDDQPVPVASTPAPGSALRLRLEGDDASFEVEMAPDERPRMRRC